MRFLFSSPYVLEQKTKILNTDSKQGGKSNTGNKCYTYAYVD